MAVTAEQIREALSRLALPDGGTLVSRDMLRAVQIEGGQVRFVIEAPNPEIAKMMEHPRNSFSDPEVLLEKLKELNSCTRHMRTAIFAIPSGLTK